MVIKLSYIILLFGVGAPAFLASPEITEGFNQSSAIRGQRKEQAQQDRLTNLRTAQAETDSKMALDRVKAGCVPVVSQETKKSTRLTEGLKVQLADGSGVALSDGSIICTRSRDTAEVWEGQAQQV